jgi:hypothetical protein
MARRAKDKSGAPSLIATAIANPPAGQEADLEGKDAEDKADEAREEGGEARAAYHSLTFQRKRLSL